MLINWFSVSSFSEEVVIGLPAKYLGPVFVALGGLIVLISAILIFLIFILAVTKNYNPVSATNEEYDLNGFYWSYRFEKTIFQDKMH